MKTYNLDALVKTVEKFAQIVAKQPELAAGFLMIEQYSVRAVKENEGIGAVPWRHHGLLM
jgi:hypothetical protein